VGSPSFKTENITVPGYYYFDGTVWQALGYGVSAKQQFYMPSIVIPTDPGSLPADANYSYAGSTITVNLYNIYKQQYQYTATPAGSARSLSGATLRTFDADKLDFFVTYYDNTVFQNVTISTAGVLTYQLTAGCTITEKTFMNIMFQEK
jgi:hypothetical protein